MGSIARVEALRAISNFNVHADGHAQAFNQRQPRMSRHPGIHRGLQHHDGVGTFWNRFEDRSSGCLNVGKIGLEVVRDRRRNRDEDDVAIWNRLGR